MKKLMFVVGIVLATGCGSKAENALAEMESFKDKMCACKDAACVESVEKDMEAWEKKMKDSDIKKSDLSEDLQNKAREVGKELRKCRREAKGNE